MCTFMCVKLFVPRLQNEILERQYQKKVKFALVHKEINVQLEIIKSAVKFQKKEFLETSLNFLMEHWPVPK